VSGSKYQSVSKSILRQINLLFLSIGAGLFGIFAIYQSQIDGTAQAIVRSNSNLLSSLQQQTYRLAHQLANQSWHYDRAMSADAQKQFQSIEQNSRQLAHQIQEISGTKIREGINAPSVNNAELIKQKLLNLAEQNLVLAGTVNAHICFHQQAQEFRRQQSALDRNLESYANTADYAEGLGILLKIDRNYQTLAQMIKDTTHNCFPPTLRDKSIYNDVQGTANTDLSTISNYQQNFLQPLIKLYQAGNYGAVPDFLEKHKQHSQVKIIFAELWRASYLATELRSIALAIAKDNQI